MGNYYGAELLSYIETLSALMSPPHLFTVYLQQEGEVIPLRIDDLNKLQHPIERVKITPCSDTDVIKKMKKHDISHEKLLVLNHHEMKELTQQVSLPYTLYDTILRGERFSIEGLPKKMTGLLEAPFSTRQANRLLGMTARNESDNEVFQSQFIISIISNHNDPKSKNKEELTIISFIKKILKKKRDTVESSGIPDKVIITRKHHPLSKTNISVNALKVLNRLHQHGYQAMLVGGSVRDLLLGAQPKDFDVATNANPTEVKKLFRNARLIGRRFKLVHILFYRDIIEVATFRKEAPQSDNQHVNQDGMLIRDNEYGSITDDVWRRDFTINALYYNIADFSIIDFTAGYDDLNDRIIRMIGDPDKRYQEDPVRMIRAIRFCAKLGFSLEAKTESALHRLTPLLDNVSSSRLFEEVIKLYHHGHALRSQHLLEKHHIFKHLFPYTFEAIQNDATLKTLIDNTLKNTDNRIKNNQPVTPAFLLAVFLWRPLLTEVEFYQNKGLPPLPALEKAMNVVLSKQSKHINIPKRFTQSMREMWVLQFRFNRRHGNRAFRTLAHPRFRAAYDFLLLRTLIGEEDIALSDWWTAFQEVDESAQQEMVKALSKKKRR